MALYTSKLGRALPYKVITQDDAGIAINQNVSGGPCTLHSITVDNLAGSAINYVRVTNGDVASVGGSQAILSFACDARAHRTLIIPGGLKLNRSLSFWLSSDTNPQGTNAPLKVASTNKLAVTLVIS